jgi:uncharacterized protein (DUF2236 family)
VIAHRINGERIVLAGWSRAILLQLAHPLVAAGVAEHSEFRGGALAAARRLQHTVRAMLDLAFGEPAAADATLARIRAIHRRVHGTLRGPVGPFAAGHPYSAEDPALVLWVHATLVESVLIVYERIIAPLSEADRDRYCEESAAVAVALGAREQDVPRRWEGLRAYVEAMSASGQLVVGPDARTLARPILFPPLRLLTAPAGWMNRLVTAGLLPAELRRQYGLSWTPWRSRGFAIVMRLLWLARKIVPFGWLRWRDARGRSEARLPSHLPAVRPPG